jgi:hypothetical protein
VDFRAQGLAQLFATDVRNGVQCQAVVQLIVVHKVFPDAVDDQVYQLVLLVQEKGNGKVSDLLLRVFSRRDEVHCLEMSEAHVPTENVYVEELCRISTGARPWRVGKVPCRRISSSGSH